MKVRKLSLFRIFQMKVGDELKCHLWVFLTDRKRIMGRASRNLRVLLWRSLQGTLRLSPLMTARLCTADWCPAVG